MTRKRHQMLNKFQLHHTVRVSHNRWRPFLPVGQPKVHPWLPDRATKMFTICLYSYVVGQPKCLARQPQFHTGSATGQHVFKTNVKLCTVLQTVKTATYLGIKISNYLRWTPHIDKVSKNANKSMGFIKRYIKTNYKCVKTLAYNYLVCPHLASLNSVVVYALAL